MSEKIMMIKYNHVITGARHCFRDSQHGYGVPH